MKKRVFKLVLFALGFLSAYAQTRYADHFHNEQIIEKPHITISYAPLLRVPYYVGETLTPSMLTKNYKRDFSFYEEKTIAEPYRVKPSWYTNTGFDRGHLAPAADFSFSRTAMQETFTMANIAPQEPRLNRYSWKGLEEEVRKLTLEVDTMFVVTGVVVDGHPRYICKNVSVPSYFYKAILGKKNGDIICSKAWIYTNSAPYTSAQMQVWELEDKIGHRLFTGIH